MTYEEIRFTYITEPPSSDRERKAIQAVETALSGLNMCEWKRVLAGVIVNAESTVYYPYWQKDDKSYLITIKENY